MKKLWARITGGKLVTVGEAPNERGRTETVTCQSCGRQREVPERHDERGPQYCNGCGATILSAEPEYKPA